MQNKPSEEKLAKAAYNWLRVSPIATIITLIIVGSFDIAWFICYRITFSCNFEDYTYINTGFGVLVSALWHLILLQYVNNKDSEFVRKHGRQALIYAGVRTAVAFFGVLADFFLSAGGGLACITIIILFTLWLAQTNTGLEKIKKELEENPDISRDDISQPLNTSAQQPKIYLTDEGRAETLNQIWNNLNSEDDVAVLQAIMKLNEIQESNAEILKQLEMLAENHANRSIRVDARIALLTLQENKTISDKVISTEVTMNENETRTPEEILNDILANLKSKEDEKILQSFEQLKNIKYSSEAIRRQVEKIFLSSSNSQIRDEAFEVLNLASNRAVQKSINSLDKGIRFTILKEVKKWLNDGLLSKENADVIQSRYDFDFVETPRLDTASPVDASQATPQPASAPQKISQPEKVSEPEKSKVPAPTLLQTLTSEASIKVYLYLGAFFVIAAAAILGAAVPELRLPILILGTLIFGGLAIAIKKRLPQPSFALFIVFSFLLPITGNSVEQSLQSTLGYASSGSAIFWVLMYLFMAIIWGVGTRLYESRLFSVAAFGAVALAFFRIGNVFDAEPEIYTLTVSLATFIGLAGVWAIKKWRDANFALPLFISTQILQGIILVASIVIFGVKIFDPANAPLWNLVAVFVWIFASVYYLLSEKQYPAFVFEWFTAATLIPLPWFLAAALDLESLGSAIVLFIWGITLAIASEILNRVETLRKFSLPILLASIPTFGLSLVTAFAYGNWLLLITAFGIAILFAVLHTLRTRWWLWVLALLNFTTAYFAFFSLEIFKNLEIPLAFTWLGLSILFLIPDLFLKKDWSNAPQWRLPLRIYGIIFVVLTTIFTPFASLVSEIIEINIAIIYAVYAVFFTIYALAYKSTKVAYLATASLPIAIIFAFVNFNIDAWLSTLTFVSIVYFLLGIAIQSKEKWSFMLRNSALILGSLISLFALATLKETSGWYAFAIGLLFITEMILRRNGYFEIAAPAFFSSGIFLILHDFNITQPSTQLLIHSLVWIFADLLTHLTFKHARPFNLLIRGIALFISATNLLILVNETNIIATTGFGIYTLLFLMVSLLYKSPTLFYTFTLTLPLFITFLLRNFNFEKWIHPVIFIAFGYYTLGFLSRAKDIAKEWGLTLLYSGLGLGILVSVVAPTLGGLDATIPIAVAATLWAIEAFLKKNVWLAFPANGFYLLAYFVLLSELNVTQPQFFSIGAALLGLIQHYLLVKAGSKGGAFAMGMLSQFVLVGTTYIQMINENELIYFFVLFLQSLAVLVYGIIFRSRSLTFFPIGFVVLGVITVVFGQLQGIATIFLIGCAGILLLGLGIGAVLLRERIAKLGERLSDWQA